jgi:hypothetical protein
LASVSSGYAPLLLQQQNVLPLPSFSTPSAPTPTALRMTACPQPLVLGERESVVTPPRSPRVLTH